jgi:hypothetical protein
VQVNPGEVLGRERTSDRERQQLLDGGVIESAPGTSEYLDDRIVALANDFDRAAVAARAQEYLDANG